jgi:hypothetical protein
VQLDLEYFKHNTTTRRLVPRATGLRKFQAQHYGSNLHICNHIAEINVTELKQGVFYLVFLFVGFSQGCEMKGTFSDLEVLGMFVGCLCHDLDHRGTNNAFQEK